MFRLPLLLALLRSSTSDVLNTAELTCDFDRECAWRNLPDTNTKWKHGTRVVSDFIHSIPRGVTGSDAFAFARGDMSFRATHSAVLASDLLPCQTRPANFGFFLWRAGGSLEVCVMLRRTRRALHCLRTLAGLPQPGWKPQVVTIPPIREPFRIAFRANLSNSQQVIAIDKIAYEDVEMCDPLAQRSALPPSHPAAQSRDIPAILRYAMPRYEELPSATPDSRHATSVRRDLPQPAFALRSDAKAETFMEDYRKKQETRSEWAKRRRAEVRRLNEAVVSVPPPVESTTDSVCFGAGCERRTTEAALTVFSKATAKNNTHEVQQSCSVVSCGFEESESCAWKAVSLPFSTASLKTSCVGLSRRDVLVEAPQDDCFLLMSLLPGEDKALQLIAAPPIFTLEETTLHFWYYLPVDGTASITLCLSSLQECVWRRDGPRRNMERWWRQSVSIRPGRLELTLILEQSGQRSLAALDGLRLSSSQPQRGPALCQEYRRDP